MIEIVIHARLDDREPAGKQLVDEHGESVVGTEIAHPRITEGAPARDATRQRHRDIAHQEQDAANAQPGPHMGRFLSREDVARSNSSLTLWGRNITDERYMVGSSDAPVQSGRMHAYPAEPATYGLTFRKGFD